MVSRSFLLFLLHPQSTRSHPFLRASPVASRLRPTLYFLRALGVPTYPTAPTCSPSLRRTSCSRGSSSSSRSASPPAPRAPWRDAAEDLPRLRRRRQRPHLLVSPLAAWPRRAIARATTSASQTTRASPRSSPSGMCVPILAGSPSVFSYIPRQVPTHIAAFRQVPGISDRQGRHSPSGIVKDFFSEELPKSYKDMYKNFTGFIETINSSVLCKLDGKDADVERKPDVESSSSLHSSDNASMRTTEPLRFKGHSMLAPFTAGWQSNDLHPLVIERSEVALSLD